MPACSKQWNQVEALFFHGPENTILTILPVSSQPDFPQRSHLAWWTRCDSLRPVVNWAVSGHGTRWYTVVFGYPSFKVAKNVRKR